MTSHRPHPIPRGETWDGMVWNDPDDAVLYDDCDRCDELAKSPATGLSAEYAERLWTRMVEVEKAEARGYATANERAAAHVYYAIALFLERNTTVDPWTWPLRDVEVARARAHGLAEGVLLSASDAETCAAEWHHLESTYGCLLEPSHDGDHVGIRGEPACPGCGGYDDHTRDCPVADRELAPGSDAKFTFTDEEATYATD